MSYPSTESLQELTNADIEMLTSELARRKSSAVGCLGLMVFLFFAVSFGIVMMESLKDLKLPILLVTAGVFTLTYVVFVYFLRADSALIRNEIRSGKKIVAFRKLTKKDESHSKHGATYNLHFDDLDFTTDVTFYTRVDVGSTLELHYTPDSRTLLAMKQ